MLICIIIIFFINFYIQTKTTLIYLLILNLFFGLFCSLIIGILDKNLWFARRAFLILFITGWFFAVSLKKDNLSEFIFGILLGGIIWYFSIISLFPKLIAHKVSDYSKILLEFGKPKTVLSKIKYTLNFMGFKHKDKYYEGNIYGYTTRILLEKSRKKLKTSIIVFYLKKSDIHRNDTTDMIIQWLKDVFSYKGRYQFKEKDLSQRTGEDLLSDLIKVHKYSSLIFPSIILIILIILFNYWGTKIVEILDAHQWIPSILVGIGIGLFSKIIDLHKKLYDIIEKRRK